MIRVKCVWRFTRIRLNKEVDYIYTTFSGDRSGKRIRHLVVLFYGEHVSVKEIRENWRRELSTKRSTREKESTKMTIDGSGGSVITVTKEELSSEKK